MHDRGVVAAAEGLPDLGQREVGQLPAQIHGDLPRRHQHPAAGLAAEVVDGDPEILRRRGDDGRRGDLGPVVVGDRVLEHDLGQRQVHALPVEAGERGDPDQRTLELADVGLDLRRDELEHVRRRVQPVLGRLLAQDRDPRLQVRRLHVGDQAPLEPGAQPVLQRGQLLGRPVRADDDLLVGVVQGVEGVEELLLGPFLALQELDVVDQEDVVVAVAPLEGGLLVVAQRVDEVVGELLGAHVAHPRVLEQPLRVVADRVQQVRLAQPGVPVDEQRVVRLGRRLRDGDGGRVREPVAGADDAAPKYLSTIDALGLLIARDWITSKMASRRPHR